MANYGYEGPAPTREQCAYFSGEFVGLRSFWSRWDQEAAALESVPPSEREPVFSALCDVLGIPLVVRPDLWYEVLVERRP